ncbi:MAG: antitoxin [Nitrospirae bacterium]|nr:antitoxin [Nitrospirota bacterium]
MATITLRGIDDETREKLKKYARQEGISLNAFLLRLIKESIGTENKKRTKKYHDLDHLAGTWSEKDLKDFNEAIKDFEKIDSEIW